MVRCRTTIILKETCHDGARTIGVAMGLADPPAEIVRRVVDCDALPRATAIYDTEELRKSIQQKLVGAQG